MNLVCLTNLELLTNQELRELLENQDVGGISHSEIAIELWYRLKPLGNSFYKSDKSKNS